MKATGQDVPNGSAEGGLRFRNSISTQCHLPDSGDGGPGSCAFCFQQVEAQRSSPHYRGHPKNQAVPLEWEGPSAWVMSPRAASLRGAAGTVTKHSVLCA